MKIESGFSSPQPVAQENGSAKGAGPLAGSSSYISAPPSAGSSIGLGGDHADLSQAAVLAAAAASLPEVRSDKVAAIQESLANGSYAVSASDLAGKLIDHLLQY
jgi:negative regulator of flagellin synthesis FlgM